MFFCNFKKKTKFAQKDDILCWCFLSKNTKQHNFVFCGLNQHFVFSLFSSDDKKYQHIFFHFCFRQLKESSPFVPAYFFQTPSKFQAALCHTQTRLCFLRTFHSISCFFYPQNVCLVVPWTDVIMRQNTAHLENRKACKNVDLALHHSQFLQTWRVCFALLKQHLQHNVKIRWDWWGGSLVKLDQSWYW